MEEKRAGHYALRPWTMRSSPFIPGEAGGRYRPLKDADIAAVNENIFRILEEVGFSEATPHCIETCTAAGAVLGNDAA